ncbi:hypothetical protein N657DRAFT_648007 [Parathielavia appendiculata]|uniref:Uncharacterized protein n=1 Tax=Parathielavia appendiculata TaxID=2587402 RepID=A0AAN6TUW0_9PEZI|nr:hypothetical protein N657DRAFT_648007 [Parathielavia appendiculata]
MRVHTSWFTESLALRLFHPSWVTCQALSDGLPDRARVELRCGLPFSPTFDHGRYQTHRVHSSIFKAIDPPARIWIVHALPRRPSWALVSDSVRSYQLPNQV